MAQINLLNTSGSQVTNPSNGHVAVFSSGSLGDQGLYLKENNGNIIAVGSGGGGGSGVSSIIAGSGISVDQSTGDVTVTATGGGAGSSGSSGT